MSQLICDNILAAIETRDFRAAKRNVSKMLSKKPSSLFPVVASLYIQFKSQKIDSERFEMELMKLSQKITDLDSNGVSLLSTIILNNFDQPTFMDYGVSIKVWNTFADKFPRDTSVLETLYYYYIDCFGFKGARMIGERLKNIDFKKYAFYELVSAMGQFEQLVDDKTNNEIVIKLKEKVTGIALAIIEKGALESNMGLTVGELHFLHKVCLKMGIKKYLDVILNFIKKNDANGYLYLELKLKQLKFDMSFKDPKDVFQQSLLLVYKWHTDLKSYKLLKTLLSSHCKDEAYFLDFKKKLEILLTTLTKKYPLSMENRALYLFKLDFYNRLLKHKYTQLLSETELETANNELEKTFVQIFDLMKSVQPLACTNDILYYLRNYPSFHKHLDFQLQPTDNLDNERKCVAFLKYRSINDDTRVDALAETVFSNSKDCPNSQLALFYLQLTKSGTTSQNLLSAFAVWFNYLEKNSTDKRIYLSVSMLSLYLGSVKYGFELYQECHIKHHLRHTMLYGVIKSLVQNGDRTYIDIIEKTFQREISHLNNDLEHSVRQAISASNFIAMLDILKLVENLQKCYLCQYIFVESTFQTMLTLNDSGDFEEMFERCFYTVFDELHDNRDFHLFSEFRKFDVTNEIIEDTLEEDLDWMQHRVGLMSFIYCLKKRKEAGGTMDETITLILITGLNHLKSIDFLASCPNEYQHSMNISIGSRKQSELLDETRCFHFLRQIILECERELFGGKERDPVQTTYTMDEIIEHINNALLKYSEMFLEKNCLISLNSLYILTVVVLNLLKYTSLLFEYISDSTSSEETDICVKLKTILSHFSSFYIDILQKIMDFIDTALLKSEDQIVPFIPTEVYTPDCYYATYIRLLKEYKEKILNSINTYIDLRLVHD